MEEILKAMKEFEKRNNISIGLSLYTDGSGECHEFWDEEELKQFQSETELIKFLSETQYKLDDKGICFSPVQIVKPKRAKKK